VTAFQPRAAPEHCLRHGLGQTLDERPGKTGLVRVSGRSSSPRTWFLSRLELWTTRVNGRRRITDRRRHSRFEVVGDLSGMLELLCPLPVVDVSTGGALIESGFELKVGSVHWVVIANGVEVGHAQICVKHTRPAPARAHRFLIGVEFLSLSPALTEEIVRWVSAGEGADPKWSGQ